MPSRVDEVLAAVAAEWRRWFHDTALPFWRGRAFDAELGLFHERLHLDGRADRGCPLRVRTQARQIYVYAHAHLMGLDVEGLAVARRALLELRRRAWRVDGRPGWVHALGPDGSVDDPTRDLYDHAFVLMMLAYYLRASGEPFARVWIDETLAVVDELLAAPHGGFAENDAAVGAERRQNPHMHLFEAMQALHVATGEARFLARAGEMFELFRTRFFDDQAGVLREFFAPDWTLLANGRSDHVEPGHMVEWVWLLRRYGSLAARPVDGFCARLLASGTRLGEQPGSEGFLINETDLEGRPRSDVRRLWTVTEYLKALTVEARARGDATLAERAAALSERTFATHLTGVPLGTWCDQFTITGTRSVTHIPASSFYHLFAMLAELERR